MWFFQRLSFAIRKGLAAHSGAAFKGPGGAPDSPDFLLSQGRSIEGAGGGA
ncbi:hypothetical protein HanXRQr2_Chr17g0781721 [Helianthus annuus]|uniref:Uncharacterized protein n=1 Tax=Helianthus annuus TaxID=4232 RepID=A0A9K3GSW9_HELAN|nr:hypothetical protein HanXRQr2_Chr17g0781721 [Helianthus annuus]